MSEIAPQTDQPARSVPYAATARDRGRQHRAAIISWLHRWVVSDALVIGRLLGIGSKAASNKVGRLHRAGLVQPIDHPGAGVRMWMLTAKGAEAALDLATAPPVGWLRVDGLTALHEPSRRGSVRLVHDVLAQHAVLGHLALIRKAGGKINEVHSDRDVRMPENGRDQILFGGLMPDALIAYRNDAGDQWVTLIEMQISWDKPDQRDRRLFWIDRTLADRNNNVLDAHIWLASDAMCHAYRDAMNGVCIWDAESIQTQDAFGRVGNKQHWYRRTEQKGGKSQPVRHQIETDIELHVLPMPWRSRYLGYRL